jgi:hypothetical protein
MQSSVQTKAATAMYPISRCIILTVRHMDERVIQCDTTHSCAHVMHMRVPLAGVQVQGCRCMPLVRIRPPRRRSSVSAARSRYAAASRTDLTAAAERTSCASIDARVLPSLHSSLFLARSDHMRH